jgi:hypothetical protein
MVPQVLVLRTEAGKGEALSEVWMVRHSKSSWNSESKIHKILRGSIKTCLLVTDTYC